eukprot:Blabericola_migrator_1__7037@NODE_356_length_9460_cov_81_744810_g285_i0_p1_GENE_NODE_356_length_9460_cov_81_744810_g285_i0NODE_356_length_9460_cov_81_744810_g285_i0_p1_ORF_typecomplete_len2608_score356_48RCC1/PF00415_18/0_019RCC1/PF00415_18/41RCC1/PF00415_18/1_8e03RCC1/PF00415_18/0_00024RCC1/PF00415_18/0_074RCC1/PF00415_18/2_5e02RCC1_2/PF13540_6/0_0017RCC1_2/PF13540_6/0_013RCC1_2/PF13540_6/0_0034RCC1_2/PF13540_6/1_1e03_NODE_356_length_9460_cov_81_744810_g285_i0647887
MRRRIRSLITGGFGSHSKDADKGHHAEPTVQTQTVTPKLPLKQHGLTPPPSPQSTSPHQTTPEILPSIARPQSVSRITTTGVQATQHDFRSHCDQASDFFPQVKRIKLNEDSTFMYQACDSHGSTYFLSPIVAANEVTQMRVSALSSHDPTTECVACPEPEEMVAAQRNFATHAADLVYWLDKVKRAQNTGHIDGSLALLRWAILRRVKDPDNLKNPTYCHQLFMKLSGRLSPKLRFDSVVTSSPEFVQKLPYTTPAEGSVSTVYTSRTDASRVLVVLDKCCSKIVLDQGDSSRGRPPMYSYVSARVTHHVCHSIEDAIRGEGELKFENCHLSYSMARPTGDLTLNKRVAAATPRAFHQGGPLANSLLSSEWNQTSEAQSLLLSSLIQTMYCHERSRFINLRPDGEIHIWDLTLDDFTVQISNFTQLFSQAAMSAFTRTSEAMTHSLIKLPFYSARWNALPDSSSIPCTMLSSDVRLTIKGNVISGWPHPSPISCPSEFHLMDVALDQLPDYLLWAVHHCPEETPCTLWVNDPHNGLLPPNPNQRQLPLEVGQTYFVISDLTYTVKAPPEHQVTWSTLIDFLSYAADGFSSMFSIMCETTWQLVKSETQRPAFISMVPDPAVRSILKKNGVPGLRAALKDGVPFGQGWLMTTADDALPPTSVHVDQLLGTLKRLIKAVREGSESEEEAALLEHEVNSVYTAESFHTTSWTGDTFFYICSILRPRPSSRLLQQGLKTLLPVRSTHHLIVAADLCQLRLLLILSHKLLPKIPTQPQLNFMHLHPLHYLCWTSTERRETLKAWFKNVNILQSSALCNFFSLSSFIDLTPDLVTAHTSAAEIISSQSSLLIFADYMCERSFQIIPPLPSPPDTCQPLSALVADHLLSLLPPNIKSVASTVNVVNKPALCMSVSGQQLLIFKTYLESNEALEDQRRQMHAALRVELTGILNDASRYAITRDTRSSAKPLLGMGLLICSTGVSCDHNLPLVNKLVTPLLELPNPLDESGVLLNRWETCYHGVGQNPISRMVHLLWGSLKTLLDLETSQGSADCNRDGAFVIKGVPSAVASDLISSPEDWDRALLKSSVSQTAGALMALLIAQLIQFGSADGLTSFLREMPKQQFKSALNFIRGVLTESLFATYSGPGAPKAPLMSFAALVDRAFDLVLACPPNLPYCLMAITGFIINPQDLSLLLPYRPSFCGQYYHTTKDNLQNIPTCMKHISLSVPQSDSLPELRLLLYEGETPELRNQIRETTRAVARMWHSLTVSHSARPLIASILMKASDVIMAIVATPSEDLFQSSNALYEQWQSLRSTLTHLQYIHCIILRCISSHESVIPNLMCSVGWTYITLALGRLSNSIRWAEYTYAMAVSLLNMLSSHHNYQLKSVVALIAASMIQLLTASSFVLHDPDLSVVYGTLARALKRDILNPLDATELCHSFFHFVVGPPDLPPASMKMVARLPCKKKIGHIIGSIRAPDGKALDKKLESFGDRYIPYDIRSLLSIDEGKRTGAQYPNMISVAERADIENIEAAAILLWSLTRVNTFSFHNCATEKGVERTPFTHPSFQVLMNAVQQLESNVYFNLDIARFPLDEAKAIRRLLKSQYSAVIRSIRVWSRGNNGLAAALGLGAPKCLRYDGSLAAAYPKFHSENQHMKSVGEDVWWNSDPLPCVNITPNSTFVQIACGEHHTVCLAEDRHHLVLMGSNRSGQLGFKMKDFECALIPGASAATTSYQEDFRLLKKRLLVNYLSANIFYDLSLGIASKPSTNYMDIRHHLPWSVARPLVMSIKTVVGGHLADCFVKQIGAGAQYTALMLDSAATKQYPIIVWGQVTGQSGSTLPSCDDGSTELSTGESSGDQDHGVNSMFVFDGFEGIPVKMACGPYHMGILTSAGNCYIWGRGDAGQLGLPGTKEQGIPQRLRVFRYALTSEVFRSPSSTLIVSTLNAFFEEIVNFDPAIVDILLNFGAVWWSLESQHLMFSIDHNIRNAKLESLISVWIEVGKLWELRFLSLACGEAHNVALCEWEGKSQQRTESFLVSWGQNEYGQLGSKRPQLIVTRDDVRMLTDTNTTPLLTDKFQRMADDPLLTQVKSFPDLLQPLKCGAHCEVYAGGAASACLSLSVPTSVWIWGNNDGNSLCSPTHSDAPILAEPFQLTFERPVSHIHFSQCDSYTTILFQDGTCDILGEPSGLGGGRPQEFKIPPVFDLCNGRNWSTINRLSSKHKAWMATPKTSKGSPTLRIPFAITTVGIGGSHCAYGVDTTREISLPPDPMVLQRRSFVLRTTQSVATNTTPDSPETELNDLMSLLHRGPEGQEELMNRIVMADHHFKVLSSRKEPPAASASPTSRTKFLSTVGQSGLQGLTHLSQILIENVVQKGILENVDTWLEKADTGGTDVPNVSAVTTPVSNVKSADKPRRYKTSTPSDASPRERLSHRNRGSTHSSASNGHSLSPQMSAAWTTLNKQLAPQPLTHFSPLPPVNPVHPSGYSSPCSSRRQSSHQRPIVTAGSSVFVPRDAIARPRLPLRLPTAVSRTDEVTRPASANIGPMWQLSRPLHRAPVSRAVTGPGLGVQRPGQHVHNMMMRPLLHQYHPPPAVYRRAQGTRVVEYDGLSYVTRQM